MVASESDGSYKRTHFERNGSIMRRLVKAFYWIAVIALFASLVSCGKTEAPTETPASTSTPSQSTPEPSPLMGFERDLQYVKNGQYAYIWIFSRKDGKALNKEDSAFLRTNAPQVVDWVITDEGKKVIAGTNFDLEEGNMAALKKRFNAENYTGR